MPDAAPAADGKGPVGLWRRLAAVTYDLVLLTGLLLLASALVTLPVGLIMGRKRQE